MAGDMARASDRPSGLVEHLRRLVEVSPRLVIGLMSGTSLDGVDAAVVSVKGHGETTEAKLLAYETYPYEATVFERLLGKPSHTFAEMRELEQYFGEVFALAVREVVQKAGVELGKVHLIGSSGVSVGGKWWLGSAAVIAERTGVTVIDQFRVRDIAAGGRGAPLSPYVDWVLFHDARKSRIIQNIGGIANLAVLVAGKSWDQVVGFDTGPGNMLIDGLMRLETQGRLCYDRDGEVAASGKVRDTLLQELMAHPFVTAPPPKAAGRAEFGLDVARTLLQRSKEQGIPFRDLIATATAFTARSIAYQYQHFVFPRVHVDEIVVGGGGVHNPTLMSQLRNLLAPVPVLTHEAFGISSDAREAMSWAILANETLFGECANLPSVTGARRRVVLGQITPGLVNQCLFNESARAEQGRRDS